MTIHAVIVRDISGFLAAACIASAVAGCAGGPIPTRAECAPVAVGSITESKLFTPYEFQKGFPLDPVVVSGNSAAVPERMVIGRNSVDGLARRYTVDASNGAVYSYYLDSDIGESTLSEFFKRGGIELDQEPDAGSGSFAAFLLSELGDRAVSVTVGDYSAALTWGDPDAAGVRVHGLYWFDGKYNYSLIGDRPAEALIGIGRNLVCG